MVSYVMEWRSTLKYIWNFWAYPDEKKNKQNSEGIKNLEKVHVTYLPTSLEWLTKQNPHKGRCGVPCLSKFVESKT